MIVQAFELKEQRQVETGVFPLALAPSSDQVTERQFFDWLTENKEDLRAKLVQHGAILFRGFPINNPDAFEKMLDAAEFENMPYVGGAAPRNNVTQRRVLTANESPPSEPIPFHHEMAQVPKPPAYVFFYCDLPSETGGETAICHSNAVYQRFHDIDPTFCEKVEELGVRYVRIMPPVDDPTSAIGRSWVSTFQTEDKEEAEDRMKALGTTWEWYDNGDLRTETATVPAIRVEPRTGLKTFFNSMVAAYTGWVDSRNDPTKAVCCGDGTPVNGEALKRTAVAMQEEAVAFQWQKGDVLWIDNALVLHSRRPFTGQRRILASIAKA